MYTIRTAVFTATLRQERLAPPKPRALLLILCQLEATSHLAKASESPPFVPNLAHLMLLPFAIDASQTGSHGSCGIARGGACGLKALLPPPDRGKDRHRIHRAHPLLVLPCFCCCSTRSFKYPGRPWFRLHPPLAPTAPPGTFCCDSLIILSLALLLQLTASWSQLRPRPSLSRRSPVPSEVHVY